MRRDELAEAFRSGLRLHAKTASLLKRRPGVAGSLAMHLSGLGPGSARWRLRQLQAAGKVIPRARMKTKGARFARAIRKVEELLRDDDLSVLLRQPFVTGDGRLYFSDKLSNQARRVLAALRAHAEGIAGGPSARPAWALGPMPDASGRGPGAPRDVWRESVCAVVARVLADAGERVTKSRDGVFASVLRCVFDVMGTPAPEDLFPHVRRAVTRLPKV